MKKLFILFLLFFITDSFASGIASNTNSAPCTNNTLETYSGNSNLAADWQPNTINLRWYNENEKLTVQQSAQSCTYDGTLTVPQTPPTRTGYTFAGWKVRLPGTYTELEYIQSTGTQYIDTAVHFDTSKDLQIIGKFINPTGDYRKVIIGSYPYGPYYNVELGGTNNHYPPSHFRNYIDGGSGVIDKWSDFALPTNTMITYDTYYDATRHLVTNNFIYNGSTMTYSFNTIKSTGSAVVPVGLRFFLDYRGNEAVGNITFPLSMGATKIYQARDLVGDFIPARRNSDGVLGMYDTVTQTFLTNGGTGNFVAGPAVQ